MKHFHLSQGDKRAGLHRPLYLQKKIKSVLTLAPFIRNTCGLVIVLNSLSEPALAFSHWRGRAAESAWNFFPSRGSVRDVPWPNRQARRVLWGFLPPGGGRFPCIA